MYEKQLVMRCSQDQAIQLFLWLSKTHVQGDTPLVCLSARAASVW